MNVFGLRDHLIQDYTAYTQGFIQIGDPKIARYVQDHVEAGALWPKPLVQLNPSFEPGESIEDLVRAGILQAECQPIFRKDKDDPAYHGQGRSLRLHKHQSDAVRIAQAGHNYVLTTGTGSGKSLAYIIPIVNHVLRHGSGRGIQAIVVYPMNALANSQMGELRKFLQLGYPDGEGLVTFERYTGQESDEEKNRIMAHPPDILLTNYVMLELILTRPNERQTLVREAQGLRFLVLDELHTYRGRQGADVALLVRRVRDALNADNLQCVGTSATLMGTGGYDEQRAQIAEVASRLFGAEVRPDHVIGETLRRAAPERDFSDPAFVTALRERIANPNRKPPAKFQDFIQDPLSIWIESTFGVKTETNSSRLIRAEPRSIRGDEGAAKAQSQLIGLPEERCAQAIEEGLLGGYTAEPNPTTGFPAFAFRLHQFISRGDTVYASLDTEADRHVTLYGQQFVPGDRDRILLPLAFCRECGQEYFTVRVVQDAESKQRTFLPRELSDRLSTEASGEAGFLYYSTTHPWPDDVNEALEHLPEEWLEERKSGVRVKPSRKDDVPQPARVGQDGREAEDGLPMYYFPTPFHFCLHCGVSYGSRQSSDFAKLTTLGSEGRSTATTILTLSAVRHLRQDGGLWRIEHVPQDLRSERLESVRRLGPAETAYTKVTFHKQVLERDQHADAVLLGPGHPLYAAVDEKLNQQLAELTSGVGLFTDATATAPYRLHFLEFEIRGEASAASPHPNAVLHAELVTVREEAGYSLTLAPVDSLHDLAPVMTSPLEAIPSIDASAAIDFLKSGYQLETRLQVQTERQKFSQIIREYLARSFDARIGNAERRVMALRAREAQGETEVALARQRAESDLADLQRARRERLNGLERLTIARNGPVRHLATLLVIPPTSLEGQEGAGQISIESLSAARQKEIELAAMRIVMEYERAREWEPVDISHIHGPGFDIRSFGPTDPATGVRPVRRIEVKGRQRGQPILLTRNEWLKAKQLGESYWLYVVWNPTGPGASPVIFQNPAQRLEHAAREVRAISHWEIPAEAIEQAGL